MLYNRQSWIRAAATTTHGCGGSESVKVSGVAMMKKEGEESMESIPWVPDPVTGYYKPEGHGNHIDPAELRELIFKQKSRRN
ncbi:hypothetical protein L6452_04362 [Arctium lappa]|uniref:Uncharacterized protein n=1 Tax=Arctium lappa TaxID=4217 RepID=A0ACB9FPE8_ARCLA|nr:hypothetical protein L6452_04362 [Arctium lappa]